jgi:hypothetical protein
VARRAAKKLVIAGIVQNQEYFETQVQPYIDGVNVEYLGAIGVEQRPAVLVSGRPRPHPCARRAA